MSTTVETKYIINDPTPIKRRIHSAEDRDKNIAAANTSLAAFMDFLKEVANFHGTTWKFEFVENLTGRQHIHVNGQTLQYKFNEKWILLDNGGSSHSRQGLYKEQTQIYYDKELSMKVHGKRVADIIHSMLKYKETSINKSNSKQRNAHLVAYAMKYMATEHKLPVRASQYGGVGYYPSSDESSIYFNYHNGVHSFAIVHQIENDKTRMSIKDSDLNLGGSYSMGGLATKHAEILQVVEGFEQEFSKMIRLLPSAIKYAESIPQKRDGDE